MILEIVILQRVSSLRWVGVLGLCITTHKGDMKSRVRDQFYETAQYWQC
jgi:hypothetical protein